MIPLEQRRDVTSSGVEGTAAFEISGKDAAHIMTILRDTLYSDKVLAVLREYSSNAWDANRMAGRGDRPIEVSLPTYGEPTLKIRDRGPGLSLSDVFEVYNRYGASTKRDSNVAVGMLGIGSKSGFAYSDSFTIVSYHGGKRMTFVAVIDASEKGRVDLLDTAEGIAGETGVEIQIPVRPHDIQEFERKARELFAFYNPQPTINTALPERPAGKDFLGLGTVLEAKDRYNGGSKGWTAVMGCVPYKVNLGQLSGLSSSARNVSGILYFDIGELQVAASREELKYGDATKAVLVERINTIIDRYVEFLLDGVDKLSQWERRLRVKQINELYLPLPADLKTYGDSYVQFDQDPLFKLKARGYRGKIDSSSGVKVASDTRLVFRNEKRVLQGYAFLPGDVIVDALDDKTARVNLAKQIAKHRVEGIPMVNISTLQWTRPASGPHQPVDAARARAFALVLDPTNIGADRKSERWTPQNRVALDSDVLVVLESYTVDGLSDFYETYQHDRDILEAAGGKMPPIIGYRHTQANPVRRDKLRGTEYRKWRDDGYVKLLRAQPHIDAAVKAKVWNDAGSGIYLSSAILDAYPAGHRLKAFIQKVNDGKNAYGKFDRKLHLPVDRIMRSLVDSEAKDEWKEILKLYPLLATVGEDRIGYNYSNHHKLWEEYVLMLDRQREAAEEYPELEPLDREEGEQAA